MPFLRGRAADDRGAISSIFAVVLASGLLFAIIGIVVDTGQVYVERQLVRNAADAVADTVATHCAKDAAGANCLTDSYSTWGMDSATATNTAYLSAIANPKGGNAAITNICGKSTASLGLPACPALTGGVNDCHTDLAANSSYANWVRVYTSTAADGFKPAFMNLVSGKDTSYQESACAQVYWGRYNQVAPSSGTVLLPTLMATCDVLPSKFGQISYIKESNSTTACSAVANWQYGTRGGTAHGFKIFDPTSSVCYTEGSATCTSSYATDIAKVTTAASAYPALINTLSGSLGKTFVLPVMGAANGTYSVQSYVSFTLLAFNFPTWSGGGKSVSATSARQLVTGAITSANITAGCGATPTSTTVPCIAGIFSTKVITGYNQAANAAPVLSTAYPNLGYQMIMHVN